MAYEVSEAKQMVIEAGKKLIETGLIARTWGNVSARISDTQFCITPSGLPYETLTPDEIVVVNIADCSYEGDLKPSSEKKMHAMLYGQRPEVNFIIHTHQMAASAMSHTGTDIAVPASYVPVLGSVVPTAAYGLSSTTTLSKNVLEAVKAHPDCNSVLMMHHGAVCMGKDYEDSFRVASALEETSKTVIAETCAKAGKNPAASYNDLAAVFTEKKVPSKLRSGQAEDLGCSARNGSRFTLTMKDGSSFDCNVETGLAVSGTAPTAALLHSAIYRNSNVSFIHHRADPETVALSREGEAETPYLDDFAQIAGFKVKNLVWDGTSAAAEAVGKAAKNCNAVLIRTQGALCTGTSDSNAGAVELVLEKECKSHMYASLISGAKPVAPVGRFLERKIYVMKYSKIADEDKK